MSKKFVRNITDTKIRGEVKEPFYTNTQNDLLSDEEDVFVRNKDEYHALTDNIKTIKTRNNTIVIEQDGKNGIFINPKRANRGSIELGSSNDEIVTPFSLAIHKKYVIEPLIKGEINDIPQSDWEETDEESKAFIKNKPVIGGDSLPVRVQPLDDKVIVQGESEGTEIVYSVGVNDEVMASRDYVDDSIGSIPPVDLEPINKKIDDHIDDEKNPHKTNKDDVGLGDVVNATQSDVVDIQEGSNKYINSNQLNTGLRYISSYPSNNNNIDIGGGCNYFVNTATQNNLLKSFSFINISQLKGTRKFVIYKASTELVTFGLAPSFASGIDKLFTSNTEDMGAGVLEIDVVKAPIVGSKNIYMFAKFTSYDVI